MSQLQYIGARYVPIWYVNTDDQSADWQPNVEYEPLTFVTSSNNHLYLSKKTVPDTIGNPANNIDYWLDMGVFTNAQIAQLQSQVDNIENVTIPALDARIDNLEMEDKILFVSDSYGINTNSSGKTIPDIAASYLNIAYDQIHRAGAGFTRDNIGVNFKDVLTTYTGDADDITYIYIFGGANDRASSVANILSGMTEFVTYARATFPNLKKILLAAISMSFDPTHHRTGVRNAYKTYMDSDMCGIAYVKNSEYVMHNTNLFNSDKLHPNSDGVNECGLQLAKGFSGECDVKYYVQVSGSAYTGSDYTVAPGPGLFRILHNNENSLYFLDETIATINFTTARNTNNFDDPIFNLASPYIIPWDPQYDSNVKNYYYTSCDCIAIITYSGGTVTIPAKLYVDTDGHLVFRCSTGGSGLPSITSVTIRQSGPMQFMTDMS